MIEPKEGDTLTYKRRIYAWSRVGSACRWLRRDGSIPANQQEMTEEWERQQEWLSAPPDFGVSTLRRKSTRKARKEEEKQGGQTAAKGRRRTTPKHGVRRRGQRKLASQP